MLAKAKESDLTEEQRKVLKTVQGYTDAYESGVEAALAWVLGERREPPIEDPKGGAP